MRLAKTFRAKAPLCNAERAAGGCPSPAASPLLETRCQAGRALRARRAPWTAAAIPIWDAARTECSPYQIRNVPRQSNSPIKNQKSKIEIGFTLIELLVVIAIIGVLAAITLPNLRSMTKSNAMIAANRQMLDDLAYARQRAISDHTTVFVVFIPPYITNFPTPADPKMATMQQNLKQEQYTTYALLSLRSVGEQPKFPPGSGTPRYLTGWRSLPNGVFIAQSKFTPTPPPNAAPFPALPVGPTSPIPFPVSTNFLTAASTLPCVGFDYLGRLITGTDELIPLARGSIFYDPSSSYADVQENPPGNSNPANSNYDIVHIDWLTGKARIDKVELQ